MSCDFEQADGFDDFVDRPRIAVGVAEGHRDVDDRLRVRLSSAFFSIFSSSSMASSSVWCWLFCKKGRRNRIREAERAHGLGGDGALRAFFVDHDADDLDVIGRIEFFENVFGVGHLRDGVGRDERDGVDVLEAGADQGLQIVRPSGRWGSGP